MTNFKEKEGGGVLFVNDKKTHPRAPDWKGKVIADRDYSRGSEIKLSGWTKPTPRNQLISLSIDNYAGQNRDKQWPKPVNEDEEVPF